VTLQQFREHSDVADTTIMPRFGSWIDAAKEYESGNDEYTAFRYRFDLQDGSGDLRDLDVGVKDNIAVAGVPVAYGSRAINFVPSYHATAVSRFGFVDFAPSLDHIGTLATSVETAAHVVDSITDADVAATVRDTAEELVDRAVPSTTSRFPSTRPRLRPDDGREL